MMITLGILTLIPHENNAYFDEIAKHARVAKNSNH